MNHPGNAPPRAVSDRVRDPLDEDAAEVALCELDALDLAAEGRARALLGADEATRAGRFVFERDRRVYTLAHGFLRLVLAGKLGCEPRALRFDAGAGQRPELAGAAAPPLRFNLSHTRGLVAVVTARAPCGVDVEGLPELDHRDLVDAVLAPGERAELLALPAAEQRARFLEIWTLKEAYLKGIGLGLARPPGSVSFSGFSLAERRCDDDRWRFFSHAPTARHHLAAALLTDGRPARFRIVDATALLADRG